MKDYYEILNITPEEKKLTGDKFNELCKKKYRALCLKWHPDKFATASEEERKEAEEKFKEISEAHAVLSDPEKRRMYDNGGFNSDMGGFNPNDFGVNMDPFSFFTGGRARQRRGKDLRTAVVLTVEECFKGGRKTIKIPRQKQCEHCHGTGSDDGQNHVCPECGGTGMKVTKQQSGNSIFIRQEPCQKCHGTGRTYSEPCKECGGSGVKTYYDEIEVDIPSGVSQGMMFAIQGQGEPGPNGAPNGNLYVEVAVQQNEGDYFVIDDDRNVVHIEEVPFNEALCGTEKKVRCLDGKEKTLKIPELTKNETSFVLRGKGLPDPNGQNVNGDYYVIVRHTYPKKLNKKQKELLKNFNKE